MRSNYPNQVPSPEKKPGNLRIVIITASLVVIAVCCMIILTLVLQARQEEKRGTDTPIESETTQIVEDDTAPVPEPPIEEDTPAPSQNTPSSSFSVEDEVEVIRARYNSTQAQLDTLTVSHSGNGGVYYHDSNQNLLRLDIPESPSLHYHKQCYFHQGELYFAFVFAGTLENRLYFKDGTLFRWIDEQGIIHDNERGNVAFLNWETDVLNEIDYY